MQYVLLMKILTQKVLQFLCMHILLMDVCTAVILAVHKTHYSAAIFHLMHLVYLPVTSSKEVLQRSRIKDFSYFYADSQL